MRLRAWRATTPFGSRVKVPLLRHIPFVIALCFMIATIIGSTGTNALDPLVSSYVKRAATSSFPQGWEFFTRSPRESYVEPFAEIDGELESESLLPSGQPKHFFGFSRRARGQGVELAGVIYQANEEGAKWATCDGDTAQTCLRSANAPIMVEPTVARPSLCGEVILVEYVPWPWSYRNYIPEELPAEKLMRVDVNCK